MTASRLLLVWVGVVAAPLAWFAQLAIGYGIEEGGCAQGGGAGDVFGIATDAAALVVTALAAGVAVAGIAAAAVTWRSGDEQRGYVEFLGFAGMLAGLVFLATIVLGGAGIVALDPCRQS